MPLNETEKDELARKIGEQRKAVWRGQTAARRGARKRRERERNESAPERRREPAEVEHTSVHQLGEMEAERKSSGVQSRVPALKIALLAIVGLISAIIIGIAIGYLVAIHDLIKI